jgi:hypothetical protein
VTIRKNNTVVYHKYCITDVVELLTHELVHAKQYVLGQVDNHGFCWRGDENIPACADAHINDEPWEKEAYCWEKTLREIYWQ